MTGTVNVILPLGILVIGAFAVYLLSRVLHLGNRVEAVLTVIVLLGALAAALALIPQWFDSHQAFFGSLEAGGAALGPNAFGVFIFLIAICVGILICCFSGEYLSRDPRYLVYYPLVLLTVAGLLGMFMALDLFNLFLLAELTTVTASALVAFRFHQEDSIRAGYKYLIMSSLGTMIMLFGIYFVYRSTGNLRLDSLALAAPDLLSRIGSACFLVGFSLKAGVVPLHTWVPEVYSQAPSAISGLLAGVLSKSMLFLAVGVCLKLGLTGEELGAYLMIFACLNMLLGSLRALNQRSLRRFLSYSSIAQTGYLMFALGIGLYYDLDAAFSAALFLFLVIAVMKSLAFLSAGIYEYYLGPQDLQDLKGAARRMPIQAFCLSIALAGLAGIPLLAGFNGKWMVFSATAAAGDGFAWVGLVVFLMSTLIGLGGYLPILVRQYQLPEPDSLLALPDEPPTRVSLWMSIPVGLLTGLVLVLGVLPGPWVAIIQKILEWITL